MEKEWRPDGWRTPNVQALKDVKAGFVIKGDVRFITRKEAEAYEAGADAMHKADVDWLIQRIAHDDRGYVFNMNSKEWLEFIKR